MDEQAEPASTTSEVIRAISPVVRDIYHDTLQPGAQEVGRMGETLGKAINVALAPVRLVVVGLDAKVRQLEEGLKTRLSESEAKIVEPPPNVAVPALAAFAYCADIPDLREMYLNLLASSMHRDSSSQAHPSYVEIIRQLTPDEAKIMHLFRSAGSLPLWQFEANRHAFSGGAGYFEIDLVRKRLSLIGQDAGCDYSGNVPGYIDNLLRLGLVYETRKWPYHVRKVSQLQSPTVEKWPGGVITHGGKRLPELAAQHPEIEALVLGFSDASDHLMVWNSELRLTRFGVGFCLTCVTDSVVQVHEESGRRSITVLAEEAL